jgi:hypothetical protein
VNNKTVSLQFSVGDLPMICYAFKIARATAMMCRNKIAEKRLEEYVKMVDALIPEEARLFNTEEWAEICICIAACKEWSITIGSPEWDRHGHHVGRGRIRVQVDNEVWLHDWLGSGRENLTTQSPEFLAVEKLLQEIAGMDSQQVEEIT